MARLGTRVGSGLTLAAALMLGGCTFTTPITSQFSYAPSDGTRLDVTDDVTVENIMMLNESPEEPYYVYGALVNNSYEPVEVSFDFGQGAETISLEPRSQILFNRDFAAPVESELPEYEYADLVVEGLDAVAGSTVSVSVSGPGGASHTIDVPVLDGTLPPYDEVLEQAEAPSS